MDDLVKQALADRIEEHDAAFTNLHREYDRRGDHIEELEAKLLSATMDGYDMAKYEYRDRIEELEAKLAKAVDVIEWALICWDDHNKHGYNMEGDWVFDARATIAELKGQNDE